MENGFHLITGTSRGIGEALTQVLLEKGNTVLGVSRGRSEKLQSEKYHHVSFDLTDTGQMEHIMEKVNEIVDGQHFDFVCLVSNSSAVDPVGSIENCPAGQIEAHVKIGLIAPMILVSLFVQKFSGHKARKKIVFISSGAAVTPLLGESVYCSTKAGINMLAQCIGAEQKNTENGFEVISISPGMVDTAMQEVIRSKPVDEFALANFFKQAFEDGKLQEPLKVAEKLYTIMMDKNEPGEFIRVNVA